MTRYFKIWWKQFWQLCDMEWRDFISDL